MRVFVGLDIHDAIAGRIRSFMNDIRPLASTAKWVRPESLHVTLKFIGEKSLESVEAIKTTLGTLRGRPVEIAFRGYGFFPAPHSARVFWIGIDGGSELAQLAAEVDAATNKLGIPKENRPFSPHLTLARGGTGSGAPGHRRGDRPNRQFEAIQKRLAASDTPNFGTMAAREFFLYQSQLMAGGSRYTKIARFPLASE